MPVLYVFVRIREGHAFGTGRGERGQGGCNSQQAELHADVLQTHRSAGAWHSRRRGRTGGWCWFDWVCKTPQLSAAWLSIHTTHLRTHVSAAVVGCYQLSEVGSATEPNLSSRVCLWFHPGLFAAASSVHVPCQECDTDTPPACSCMHSRHESSHMSQVCVLAAAACLQSACLSHHWWCVCAGSFACRGVMIL